MTNYKSSKTAELVAYFKSIEGYFTGVKKMHDFIKSETGNESLATVKNKVAAVGNPGLWENGGQDSMALYIYSLHIDDRLKNGDLGLVEDISDFKTIGDPCALYLFASKYCCYHYPNLFPIYCPSGHRLANALCPTEYSDITNHYSWYSEMMDLLKTEYGLTSLNYLELSKFIWLYEAQLSNSILASMKTNPIPNTTPIH